MSVLIETSLGDLTIDLYVDDCPKASENFVKLCKIKYYNFCLFHNVQRNFILQTGDPTGTGKGGRSIYGMLKGEQYDYFKDEIKPTLKFVRRGLVAMASAGKDLNGSQFFITAGDRLDSLDGRYTIFGEVVDDGTSFETLDKINDAYCDQDGRSYIDIRIRHTIVLDDPFDDPPGLRVPSRSPSPTKDMLESGRLREDEVLDDEKDLDAEELERRIAEKEAKAGAQILSMIGDLPDENIRPPENVLFVCKLNPITTDADLELIFSRFGNILSSEIIRDRKTGDSLGYGFIEYEKEEDAEEAYLKMDNVLIDDRRIHVDFSQSVAKLWRNTATKSIMSGRNKFKIKSLQRQEKGYDYVFSDEEEGKAALKAEKTDKAKEDASKKEKSSDPRRDSREEGARSAGKERPRERSRSRDRGRERDRNREGSRRDSYRRDDRDRDRSGRDSHRGHDREGDRRRSRSRSRDRDRRDRDRDMDRRR